MKKILTAISVSLLLSNFINAQSDEDALRYSQLLYGSSGRGLGAGSAFGALGGDYSSLVINPAGVSIFQNNQFSISPSFLSIKSNSLFDSNSSEEHKYNFNASGFGIVWVKQLDEKSSGKWRNLNFAFGGNRIAGFHNNVYYTGFNPSSSLAEKFVESVNSSGGITTNEISNAYPFDAGLAYETALLQTFSNDTTQYWALTEGGGVKQEQTYTTRGGMTEYAFTMGANYNDKLYIGGSLGFVDINYRYSSGYTETDINDSIDYFKSFTLDQSQSTNGTGIDVKFGLIARLNDYIRLGGSVHSPSFLFLSDRYSSSMKTVLDDTLGTYNADSPIGKYDYNLTTPWRLNGSLALTFKKYGFLSFDYEFLDYSEAFFSFNDDNSTDGKSYENNLNQTINNKYGSSYNIRIGGEASLDVIRFRAGYALYGSPFKSGVAQSGFDNKATVYSGGIGIKQDAYFIDFGFGRTKYASFLQPYSLTGVDVPGVKLNTYTNQFTFTIGWKW